VPSQPDRPDTKDMIGTQTYTRERSRGAFVRLEMFLVAALLFALALPVAGLVHKATSSNFACARAAFQQTVAQSCK
jgi:hypothetical protein